MLQVTTHFMNGMRADIKEIKMEIKATLQKPYTEQQRIDFIAEQNHHKGYEIRETEEELQAWGCTDEELLEQLKQEKYTKALEKANIYQQEGTVEYKNCIFEMSDSNRKNLSDTQEALTLQGETETTWLDKDDNYVTLTVEDIQYIRLNLILAEIQKLWIVKYPNYKQQIEEATTVEEVNEIVIDYTQDVPEEEPLEENPEE